MSGLAGVGAVAFGLAMFVLIVMLPMWYFINWKPDHPGRSILDRAAARRERIAALEHALLPESHSRYNYHCGKCRDVRDGAR